MKTQTCTCAQLSRRVGAERPATQTLSKVIALKQEQVCFLLTWRLLSAFNNQRRGAAAS